MPARWPLTEHAFDLNAATLIDLTTVPGLDRPTANAILANAPYQRLDDVAAVPGVTSAIMDQLRDLRQRHQPQPGTQLETTVSTGTIVSGNAIRAVPCLLPMLLFAIPASSHDVRRGRPGQARSTALAWLAAVTPALTHPWL